MKIAYLTTYDSGNVEEWSGCPYFIGKSLAQNGVEVIPINCAVPLSKKNKLIRRLCKLITGKIQQPERKPAHLKRIARKAKEQLSGLEYDIVLSPGSHVISYLEQSKPVVFWTDATYDCLVNYYKGWDRLTKRSIKNGHHAEQLAIDKASRIFYASDWACESSINRYRADKHKVKQLPFGSNVEAAHDPDDINRLIDQRISNKMIHFLFVGVDWERKGGSQALQVVERLRAHGINAVLNIVGCRNISESITALSYVNYYSFLSKATEEGRRKIEELYEKAAFFILPTKAECFGVVFAEASAYGLPIITTNVGGVPSAVHNNINGYCLELKEFVVQSVDRIRDLLNSPEAYRTMSWQSFERYKNDLNWGVIGKKAVDELQSMVYHDKQMKNEW